MSEGRVDELVANLNTADWPVVSVSDVEAFSAPEQDSILVLSDANRAELDGWKQRFVELGHVGGASTTWIGATARPPSPARDLRPLYVSFFTKGTAYESLAARLEQTLKTFGLDHELHGVSSTGSWERNSALKGPFMRDRWTETGRPVVWLDADATVEAAPTLLNAVLADLSVSKAGGYRIGGGTVGFGRSETTQLLLDRWALRCEADPMTSDQIHLDAAWADIASIAPLTTCWLPQPYLFIFDDKMDEPSVITHWQASRQHRAAVSGGVAGEIQKNPKRLRPVRRASRFTRSADVRFWSERGLDHIAPCTGEEFPEGFDVPSFLRRIVGEHLPVVEVGCGRGRLAGGFAPGDYLGVDVNPHAVLAARQAHPAHTFRLLTEESDYPQAATLLFYTVLLHVDDDHIGSMLERTKLAGGRVVIAEIMDRRWRRKGVPHVYNRDPNTYVAQMNALGFDLEATDRRPYKRYHDAAGPAGRDTYLTTLVFDRR